MQIPPDNRPEQLRVDETWWHRFRPLHTARAAARMLHITEDQLAALVNSRDVLMLTAGDGDTRFPGFQFDHGTPLPHLGEAIERIEISLHRIDVPVADPWVVALRLTSTAPEWGDRNAAELLRTEHADEVLWQLAWAPVPLDQRTKEAATRAIARPIAERIMELIADLPVQLSLGTLFTTTRANETFAVVAFSKPGDVYALRYPIDGNPEATAQRIAAGLRAQFPPPETETPSA
jgi:hypothetical protein